MPTKPSKPDELREAFGRSYARMCIAAAEARVSGCAPDAVRVAMTSAGTPAARQPFTRIAALRMDSHRALRSAEDGGVDMEVLIQDARRVKQTVEQEFMLTLPIVTKGT